jgi:predicted nucleic acid-binding Zn ribbon protein
MGLEGLSNLIKGLEDQDSWQSQRQFRLVLQHWPKSVGFAVARQTRPTSIHRSELYVATATPVWAQTLTYERFKILQKLNRYQPKPIKNIRFSTALWAVSTREPDSQGTGERDRLQHPSYVGQTARPSEPSDHPPTTPTEAFERWARAIQQMQSSQSLCPRCRCRCPQGELNRWSVCALCASKRWQ